MHALISYTLHLISPHSSLYPPSLLSPIVRPTGQPSRRPSCRPSAQPSRIPTMQPSARPSFPSGQPTRQPSRLPSGNNKNAASTPPLTPLSPSFPFLLPILSLSYPPVLSPRCSLSSPLFFPSGQPTRMPNAKPTRRPSTQPSSHPTQEPTNIIYIQVSLGLVQVIYSSYTTSYHIT